MLLLLLTMRQRVLWHGVARARLRRTERRPSVDQCSPLAGPPSSKTIVLFYFLENPET